MAGVCSCIEMLVPHVDIGALGAQLLDLFNSDPRGGRRAQKCPCYRRNASQSFDCHSGPIAPERAAGAPGISVPGTTV